MSGPTRETILVADGDPLLSRALGRLLLAEGYRVAHGEPGGVEPSLVVLGLADGCRPEVVERLGGQSGDGLLPLLIVGGDAGVQSRVGRRRGRTMLLPPLFDPPQFMAAVRSALGAAARAAALEPRTRTS